jgi:hypothetical protein
VRNNSDYEREDVGCILFSCMATLLYILIGIGAVITVILVILKII